MTNKAKLAVILSLALMAVGVLALTRVQGMQRLGTPGVRVVQQDVLREDGEKVGTNAVPLPETILNYKSITVPVARVVHDWLPKDTVYGQKVYEAPDGFWIQSSVILMGTDRTSIHKPEYCLTGQGFQVTKVEGDSVEVAKPHRYSLPLHKMSLQREAKTPDGQSVVQSGLFVYWFVADNQITADHNQRMYWMARDQVTTGILQRWAYVSCFSIFHPGQEEAAYARMKEWIAAATPEFQLASGAPLEVARKP